jgi:multisubunit Na+/H+ antiporter MnhG subunit
MGACCGGALLLLALIPLVAGTGGAFAAVGSSLLTIAALLACPLGMYFMMRGMHRMEHREKEPAAGSLGTGERATESGNDTGR